MEALAALYGDASAGGNGEGGGGAARGRRGGGDPDEESREEWEARHARKRRKREAAAAAAAATTTTKTKTAKAAGIRVRDEDDEDDGGVGAAGTKTSETPANGDGNATEAPRRPRLDSSDEEDAGNAEPANKGDGEDEPAEDALDLDSDGDFPSRRALARVTNNIGLRSIKEFASTQRAKAAATASSSGSAAQQAAQTVYRDASGKVQGIAAHDTFEERERRKLEREAEEAAIRYEYFRGAIDKLRDAAAKRGEPDPTTKAVDVMATLDPMAAFLGGGSGAEEALSLTGKPTYKGPAPAPNRFGVLPGYRWDGVDRSNGFERKLLKRRAGVA